MYRQTLFTTEIQNVNWKLHRLEISFPEYAYYGFATSSILYWDIWIFNWWPIFKNKEWSLNLFFAFETISQRSNVFTKHVALFWKRRWGGGVRLRITATFGQAHKIKLYQTSNSYSWSRGGPKGINEDFKTYFKPFHKCYLLSKSILCCPKNSLTI